MASSQFFVVPITHVDLAWKRGRDEMSEMLEIVVIRLLDCLENDPDFKYHIEQAAHFRELNRRRPDLVKRLKPFIAAGRIEVVGAMASTLENNLPNGECFVRNQQMGLQWVHDTWGAEVETGWLIDTFGVNAQVPQLLRGFGFKQLMANRFGGTHTHDLFLARGLDGTDLPVAGWGSNSAYISNENLSERFCTDWDDIEICFAQADKLTGPGPFMLIPYTENQMLVSRRPQKLVAQRNEERPHEQWHNATPREFFAALEKTGRALPVVGGDLNPEFTGCFSLRQPIRLRNRPVENRLLEAEKWAALAGLSTGQKSLEEAWWQLAYVQFHDVFTGSHPTSVFRDVMMRLDEIEESADEVLQQAFAVLSPTEKSEIPLGRSSIRVFNGLPWERHDVLEMLLPTGFTGVSRAIGAAEEEYPFEVRGDKVRVAAVIPAVGFQGVSLENGPSQEDLWQAADTAALENEWIRLDLDAKNGIARLEWKLTGQVLLDKAGSWLVVQQDEGNFQIENPCGAEVSAASGSMRLERLQTSPLGETVRLSGEFPPLVWNAKGHLRWSAEFFLPTNRAEVRLKLTVDWKGEASRVRLTLPTTIDTSLGIYEIPFGVVTRKPYSPRNNAKGEWPAHRFVALENNGCGLALINTGVAGVEVNGGTLYTTLLRAPKTTYSGMVTDDTSSQHGRHEYSFSLVPYSGSWSEAGVAKFAQELNSPILWDSRNGGALHEPQSLLRLEPEGVVLSSVRAADDGSGQLVVRVYETVGRDTQATLTVHHLHQAWACDLKEAQGSEITVTDDQLNFGLKAFEIKTFRVNRS